MKKFTRYQFGFTFIKILVIITVLIITIASGVAALPTVKQVWRKVLRGFSLTPSQTPITELGVMKEIREVNMFGMTATAIITW